MKASLKLDSKSKPTKDGYPVWVRLSHLQKRHKKCIGHSAAEHWDLERNKPLKAHPDYFNLLPLVLECKATINKINLNTYTFLEASRLLFRDEKRNSAFFYEAGLTFCDDTTNGRLYRTVLNSFNKVMGNITIDDINVQTARSYMNALLKYNKPNGVHTYMRTLSALFKKLSGRPDPFKGVRPKKVKTGNKALNIDDVRKIATTRTFRHRLDAQNTNETVNHFRYYWLLMFYLGGIDMIDLAKLRYDRHVVGGRVQFERSKGGTNVVVNNKLFKPALDLLKKFDCRPYLVPIYKYSNHNDFVSNFNERFCARVLDLELTKRPLSKSARYTFITRAQQLLIDERITIEIVGHAQQSTHSIYTDEFPIEARDLAHERIITF